jgi:hypothetical protein
MLGCDAPRTEVADKAGGDKAGADASVSRPSRPKKAILGHWRLDNGNHDLFISEGGEKDLLFTIVSDGRIGDDHYIIVSEDMTKGEIKLNQWMTESDTRDGKAKIGTFSDGRKMVDWYVIAKDGKRMTHDYLHYEDGRQTQDNDKYSYVDDKTEP